MPRPPSSRTEPPRALSTDVWYTLIYLPTVARRELHRRRRAAWAAPLLRSGRSRAEVERLLTEHDRWKRRTEAVGRTPPLPEQVAWLARRSRVALDAIELAARLDRELLRAPVRTAPRALETLRELSHDGVPLGIVSNVLNESSSAAREVLDRAGLLRWFRVAYLSSDHEFAKPRPEPFRTVAEFLGVVPSQLLHVGDLRYDLDGVRRAGGAGWLFDGYARLNRYLPGHFSSRSRSHAPSVASWPELLRKWRSEATGA